MTDGIFTAAPPSWRGQLADGRSAALQDVILSREGGALLGRAVPTDGEDGGTLLSWSVETIAGEKLGTDRATLTSSEAPGVTLTVPSALLEAGVVHCPPVASRPKKRVLLLYGAAIVAVATVAYLNLDPVARAIARRVPASYEADLGRGLESLLARQYCETPAQRALLQQLAGRLGGGPREIHVLNSEMVNAFTFPGGVVILTRGLLADAQSADEVAGVLAHELEHVERRHVMIHFVRGSLLTGLWQVTVGDYAGLFAVDPKTAFDIASLRFSRDDEREADRGAMARLTGAHISAQGLRIFFERLRGKTDVIPTWLSNHPATADRIALLASGAGNGATRVALSTAEWESIHHACGEPPDEEKQWKESHPAAAGR